MSPELQKIYGAISALTWEQLEELSTLCREEKLNIYKAAAALVLGVSLTGEEITPEQRTIAKQALFRFLYAPRPNR